MALTCAICLWPNTQKIGSKAERPGIVHFDEPEEVKQLLDTFYARGHRIIDTGGNYPGSEIRLGAVGAPSRFTMITKVRDGLPGSHKASEIDASIKQSLEELRTTSVDTLMLHVPDRETPFEEAAEAINKAYQEGKFEHFGLSNYTAAEVQKFIDICETNGYVKPTVYEGHYNAIFRSGEKELFPLLRRHNMAFLGYSPAAGGLFSGHAGVPKSSKRWDNDVSSPETCLQAHTDHYTSAFQNSIGKSYSDAYGHPLIQASVGPIVAAAEKVGISGHAAALRWTAYHSTLSGEHGDAIIFTVSNMQQLHQTLDAIDAGPLPADLAEAFSALFDNTEAPNLPYHL
ncbi:Aldo/keto reductase [Xylariaceae sp. FL1019]|nr:Aldo/keto reductase [Xylariaceae sp. FL1019]